jgi:hypothetical protein
MSMQGQPSPRTVLNRSYSLGHGTLCSLATRIRNYRASLTVASVAAQGITLNWQLARPWKGERLRRIVDWANISLLRH